MFSLCGLLQELLPCNTPGGLDVFDGGGHHKLGGAAEVEVEVGVPTPLPSPQKPDPEGEVGVDVGGEVEVSTPREGEGEEGAVPVLPALGTEYNL